MQAEVRHEPVMALHGGPDGLRVIRKVVRRARQLLEPGGLIACEIGINQSRLVMDELVANGFQDVQVKKDWQDIPRIISACRE